MQQQRRPIQRCSSLCSDVNDTQEEWILSWPWLTRVLQYGYDVSGSHEREIPHFCGRPGVKSNTPEIYCAYLLARNGSLANTKRHRHTFSFCCDSNLFHPEPRLISSLSRKRKLSSDTVCEVITGSGQFSSGSSPSLPASTHTHSLECKHGHCTAP